MISFAQEGGVRNAAATVLGCFGDGGAVVTDDDDLAEHVKTLRNHGRTDHGDVARWSFDSRLDNLQAALLDLKLKTLPDEIRRRRQIAENYLQGLKGIEALRLPLARR